jgi:predicted nucleic acid-binding protein
MKKVLVDLNVILDFLNKRNHHVSRNIADFTNARIPVLLPEEFLREI